MTPRNTLNLPNFIFEKQRPLVQEYVGSSNLIVLQLIINEFQNMPTDDKHTPRRNLIRLKSLAAGHGALAY